MPDVPTFVESGFPEFDFMVWGGFSAPAGTDRQVIALLNSELNRALNDDALKQRFRDIGSTPQPTSPEEFGASAQTPDGRDCARAFGFSGPSSKRFRCYIALFPNPQKGNCT